MKKFTYDTEKYKFRDLVSEIYEVENLEKILYTDEKKYFEPGTTSEDVDARSGNGDSPTAKNSLAKRVEDFDGGGLNEPTDGQRPLNEFRTNDYRILRDKATERGSHHSVINNDFRTSGEYQDREFDEQRGEMENPGGGKTRKNDGSLEYDWKSTEYDDLLNQASDRTPDSRLDNDFRKQGPYDTEPGSSDLERKTRDSLPDRPHIHPDRRGGCFDGGGFSERSVGPTIDDYSAVPYAQFPTRTPSTTPSHFDYRTIAKSQTRHGASGNGWKTDTKVDDYHVGIHTSDSSLINFSFGGIVFKAYIGSFSETFAPGWDGQADQGRADSRYLYTSFERTISLDFIVAATSKEEQDENWKRLQKLSRLTYPIYGGSGFYGQDINVTIGDMFKNKKMIITDLGYDWDNETPWEISSGDQAPMYTTVTISLTVLGDKPQHTSTVYQHI